MSTCLWCCCMLIYSIWLHKTGHVMVMHARVVIKQLKWISLCAWRQSDERSQYRQLKVGTHNGSNSAHKGRHCVEEIWAIADTNCNWKVWMASLIESEHAHRQIIFRSRLLVLVGLSHCLHMRESCQLWDYCSGSFLSWQNGKVSFCLPTPLPGHKRTLSTNMGLIVTLRAQLMLGFHGDGGVKYTR